MEPNDIQPDVHLRLSDADAAVLDALLEARARDAEVGPLPPGSADRAKQVRRLFAALDTIAAGEDQPPDDLTARTLEAIQNARQRARFAKQIEMLRGGGVAAATGTAGAARFPSNASASETSGSESSGGGGFGFGMRRVASVAAMFVLGLSLLLPTLSHSRNEANRLACAANLGFMGQGLSRYTADNAGFFPRLTHDPIESPTAIEPGLQPRVALPKPNPNSANLFLIIRHRYVRSDQAVCPGLGMTKVQANADGTDFKSIQAVPFSYQNQVTAPALRITIVDPRRAVIADRNPLFIVQQGRMVLDFSRPADTPSQSHPMRGQNVLTADLSVRWIVRPVITHSHATTDNIWVAQQPAANADDAPQPDADPTNDAFLTP